MSPRSLPLFVLAAALGGSQLRADVATTRVAQDLLLPNHVTHAPGDAQRIFIVEKRGAIKVLRFSTGAVTEFMNIDARVGGDQTIGSEEGLLGLAFHPQYQSNGFFYVHYTNNSGNIQISRFRVLGEPATSNTGDPNSEFPILTITHPQGNHNAGWLGFGPVDGFLYIATGDGGGACDSGTGHTAGTGNAQDITNNLLGKILRIDVDGGTPYAIPADNPFVGITGDDEIWAFGLRNPFRNGFDQATGDLYIGDVGQNQQEEVDYQPGSSNGGENYGWRCFEGNGCPNGASGCPLTTGCTCPGQPGLRAPIFAYTHSPPLSPSSQVCSVIGGYVYRGTCMPELFGTYFFADFCAGTESIWSFEVVGGALTSFTFRGELSPSLEGLLVARIVSFGEDANGELYVVDQGTGNDGSVYRIVPVAEVANRNQAPNPASYTSGPAMMGGVLTATVNNNLAAQATSALFAFDSPATIVLGGGQVLLCMDGQGSGEMFTGFGLSPSSSAAGVDSYSVAVPSTPLVCGLPLYSQALQFGNPPFDLSNAQDLTIGF